MESGEPLVRIYDPAAADPAAGSGAAATGAEGSASAGADAGKPVADPAATDPASPTFARPTDPAVPLSSHAGQANRDTTAPDPVVRLSSHAGQRNHAMAGGGMAAAPELGPLAERLGGAGGAGAAGAAPGAGATAAGQAAPGAGQPGAGAPLVAPGAPQAGSAQAAAPGGPLASMAAPSPAASLEATIRLGAERGFQRARLTLKPAELGAVDVVLKASEGGVSATVLAHTHEAARLLEASGEELRRRLDLQGVQLQGLTVSVAGDASAGAGHQARGDAQPTAAPGGAPAGTAAGTEPTDPIPTPTRQIELGGGVLLDVLA